MTAPTPQAAPATAPSTQSRARFAVVLLAVILGFVFFLAERNYYERRQDGVLGKSIGIPAVSLEAYITQQPWDGHLNLLENAFISEQAKLEEVDEFLRLSSEAHQESYRAGRCEELLGKHPRNVFLRYLSARYLMKAKEMEQASAALRTLLTDHPEIALPYKDLVVSLMQEGKFADSLTAGQDGLQRARSLGDRRAEFAILGNMALVSMQSQEWDRALRYANMALQGHIELGDRAAQATDHVALALVYGNQNKREEALAHFTTAEKIALETGQVSLIVRMYSQWLLFHRKRGETFEASQVLDRVLPYLNRTRITEVLRSGAK